MITNYPKLKIKTHLNMMFTAVFNDLPLDPREEVNNNKFISGAQNFFIIKALARLS